MFFTPFFSFVHQGYYYLFLNIGIALYFYTIPLLLTTKDIYFHTFLDIVIYMERKLREINGSLVIQIPKQVCDLYNLRKNDALIIEPIGVGELKLRKVTK